MSAATLSTLLIQSLARQRANGIPADIRQKTLLHIADNVAIAIAARESSPISRLLPALFRAGSDMDPAKFAFIASAYGHMLDFDDIHDVARVHPTAVTLPAALAVTRHADVDGKDIVDAVALSNELMCRLGAIWLPQGSGPGSSWFLSQLFGYFGAALSACIVLRLDAAQTCSAFGLAYMQAAGGKEAGFGTGGNARAIYPAFAAMGGVNAALLAQSGIIGPPTAFEGSAGLFPLYFGSNLDRKQSELLLSDQAWVSLDTCVKPWPSCRLSHPYIQAAQNLRTALRGASAQRVVISVNRTAAKLCMPLEQRRLPQTLQDAKYSIPFMVAFTLVHGRVDLNNLTESALHDAQVLEMAQRVEVAHNDADSVGLPAADIRLYSNAAEPSHTFHAPFEAGNSQAMVHAKFQSCFEHAGLGAQASTAWDILTGLDQGGTGGLLGLMRAEPIGGADSSTRAA